MNTYKKALNEHVVFNGYDYLTPEDVKELRRDVKQRAGVMLSNSNGRATIRTNKNGDVILTSYYTDVAIISGGRIALSHKINCNGVIEHKTPRKIQHKLFIDCCIDEYGDGWNWFIDNEYYSNIIVVDSRDFCGVNNGDYEQLYLNIETRADELSGEIIDIIHGANNHYDTIPAAVADMLEINDIAPTQADVVKAAAYNYFSNNASFNEYAAELLTALTPHKWKTTIMRGCCQRDFVTALYPADVYNDNDISEYECYFFGMYNEYFARYNGDAVTYYYSMNYDTDNVINNIAADFGIDPAAVVYNSCY